MSDIFLSYAREDFEKAQRLAAALQRKGWDVFWDRTIPAGQKWRQYIGKKLDEAKCIVVAWSAVSVESDWVVEEAEDGRERDALVPVLFEPIRPPRGFRGIQAEDLSAWDGSETFPAFEKLVRDLETLLGPARTTGPDKEQRKSEISAASTSQPEVAAGTVFQDTLKDGSRGPEMVVVPAGEFQMGDIHDHGGDHEKPVHVVRIVKAFAIGRYPITFAEYDLFAQSTGRELPNDEKWGRDRRPVLNVSWEDALKYTKWLSEQTGKRYRLPTEAEWEYAARSGVKDETWAGTFQERELGGFAWYAANSGGRTQPVGSKKPNGLGLYDMSGNVWEWVQDYWHDDYKGAPANGAAWDDKTVGQRVIRGGSWPHSGVPALIGPGQDHRRLQEQLHRFSSCPGLKLTLYPLFFYPL